MKDSISKNNFFYKKFKDKIFSLLVFLGTIILWKITSVIVGKDIIIPSPEKTLLRMIEIIKEKDFAIIVFSTIFRTLLSFFLSLILALSFGILSSVYKRIYLIINPIVSIIRSTPTMAIILLALIWLGGEKSPIFIGFIVVFPILYSNVMEGFKNVDVKLIEMAQIYEVSNNHIIRNIYIPSIRNYLFAGINAALGLNFKVMISAEVMGQPSYAMGTNLFIEKINLEMSGVFAWAIILIVIATFFDFLISKMVKPQNKF
ncbi:ABC transporter permease subunit [Clostridium sediminicola]|uniref:ABC transporter permease n=1 Tax=Clostridium sediminicola TaxID=3114879 RepID=UPI0031F1F121